MGLDQLGMLARQLGLPNGLSRLDLRLPLRRNPASFDMLGVYTPGTTFEMYGDGSAKLLKGGKNLYLNFNIHYQTTGKPEKDRSMLGLLVSARSRRNTSCSVCLPRAKPSSPTARNC